MILQHSVSAAGKPANLPLVRQAPASSGSSVQESERSVRRAARRQLFVGTFCWLGLGLPYVRQVRGLERIVRGSHYLFACNHVSLLDTILIGTVFYRAGHLPMLVLGDKNTWSDSCWRRWLSGMYGFLVDRGRFNPRRIRELQAYARAGKDFQLVVFPEGTRGNGVDVAPCQPGIYYIAQEARLPIVPVFFANMQALSTKTGRLHPIGGLKKVDLHFGEPILPENYLALSREEFTEFVRAKILAARA